MELPVSYSLGVIGPLLRKLYSLMEDKQNLPEEVSKDLQSLIEDVEETRNSMTELSMEENPSFTVQCLMKAMREICYDTEDYIDMVFSNSSADIPEPEENISEFSTRLKRARKRLERCQKISGFKARLQQDAVERHQRCQITLDGFQTVVKSVLQNPHEVFDTPMKKLVDLLAFDTEQQLKVVPIYGPAGAGKTTLARILYNRYGGRFHCRAFLRVSQNPDTRRLLTSMISQMKWPQPQYSCGVQDLTNKVKKHLRGKTYLIIVDDLWDTSTWDILSRAFPGDSCYSRIITTTQIENVALACCSYCSNNIYEMPPVSYGHLQELLFGNSKGMKEVVALMYENLPARLKTCLLYLNMYPDDYVIRKDDLVKQWVAEGFMGAVGEEREDLATSYFAELVTRGMIQPVERNCNDDVLLCTVHHMVQDLIACKSAEENFITAVVNFETVTGFPDKVRRLSLKFGGSKSAEITGTLRMPQVRSILYSGFFRCVPSIVMYRLLRVLVLDVWSDEEKAGFNLTRINELFLLRYLRIAGNVSVTFPEQIKGLQFLETLEVDARLVTVPLDINLLQSLLHLQLPDCIALARGIAQMTSLRTLGYFDLSYNLIETVENLGHLSNLQELHLSCSKEPSGHQVRRNLYAMSQSLKRLTNLRSLTLVPGFSHGTGSTTGTSRSSMRVSCDDLGTVTSPPNLLEKLDLFPKNFIFSRLPKWIKHLEALCILKISVRRLLLPDINLLKELPSLIALSLHVQVAPSSAIDIGQEGFPLLRYFTFRCALVRLCFLKGAMPNVERLKLSFCTKEVGLRSCRDAGLEHLSSLKLVSVKVWPASGGDVNKSVAEAEACLKAAISKSVSPPIASIKYVHRISYGWKYQSEDDDYNYRNTTSSSESSDSSQQPRLLPAWQRQATPIQFSQVSDLPMEVMSPYTGKDKVMGAAQDIEKSLAVSKNPAEDTIPLWSTIDLRFHRLSSPETSEDAFGFGDDNEDEVNSSTPSSAMIDDYLYAVDDATPAMPQVYVAGRRDALAQSMVLLGIEAVSIEEVLRMEWSVLEQKMRRWSHAVRAVVRTFLAAERRLCDEVFASDKELGHECFADVARGCVLQLLIFADAVAVSSPATEKMYRMIGMYEALADVQPELEALFSDHAAREFFAGEVSSTIEKLGSTVRHTIEEFSHAIHREASRKPVHGGAIHPMTRYVLNYCGLLADCRGTLDKVLGDTSLDGTAAEANTDGAAATTPSARCIRKLLTLLLGNINDKSWLYDDAGLQNVFLINNLNYVVQKVRESLPLRELVGDAWLRKRRGQILQYEAGYLRAS